MDASLHRWLARATKREQLIAHKTLNCGLITILKIPVYTELQRILITMQVVIKTMAQTLQAIYPPPRTLL